MAEVLYTVSKICCVCDKKFLVTKVRSRLIKLGQDTDFCTYYKHINPYYYSVWVCQHCGYAAQDNHFGAIASAKASTISQILTDKAMDMNYCLERTREQAANAYKLAIVFAKMEKLPASKLAGLHLRLAWLYREARLDAEEHTNLSLAAAYYEQALQRERLPVGKMTETTLAYLVGELLRRTGRLHQSLPYFNKVIATPQAKLEKRILVMARDAWQAVRADLKRQQDTAVNE